MHCTTHGALLCSIGISQASSPSLLLRWGHCCMSPHHAEEIGLRALVHCLLGQKASSLVQLLTLQTKREWQNIFHPVAPLPNGMQAMQHWPVHTIASHSITNDAENAEGAEQQHQQVG